ncbi:MAG: metallophosphoesterase [Pseudomonadota bacterium]|nr:metallophosphoesterase [Pseudomonadota bacterium]
MRTLVHLSDLHFGRTDPLVVEALVGTVAGFAPDVVVVSGDLTQRARACEFEAARDFLVRLPTPRIVVPGNHDVPLYRVWERFLSPLGKFRRIVERDLEPAFVDAEIAVVGVNTARSLTFKHGRINEEQMAAIHRRLDPLGDAVTKIVVTHHPFDLPDTPGEVDLVGRAQEAMHVFSRCGVDLLLAGHFHISQSGATSVRHEIAGYSALVVQAGTATSTRSRGEENSFNVLRVELERIVVERQVWQPERRAFGHAGSEAFRRDGQRWRQT